jgi:hypothetical protein
MTRRLVPIFLTLVFFAPFSLKASTLNQDEGDLSLTESSVIVTTTPEKPNPRESVTISLSSYSSNLDGMNISWSEDGKKKMEGIGKKTYLFTSKDAGSSTEIDIVITPLKGTSVEKKVTVVPAGVDLLWQANDSIVPPFYRGKAMPSSESQIKFVAIPLIKNSDGTTAKQSELLYSWKENYDFLPNNSGYGKSSFLLTTNYLHPTETIEVSAQTRDESISTSSKIDVTTGLPKIVWYTMSPLYGPLYDNALTDSYSTNSPSTSIIAEPYFFSPKNPASTKLAYVWTINGQSIDTPSVPNTVFLQRGDASAGTASLGVTINNVSTLFQSMASSLVLNLK